MANKIRILTNGQTVVYALTTQAGATPTVYAADGTTPAAASGSTVTDLILVAPTLDYYTLSLKIDGTECSSRSGSSSPISFRVDGEHDYTFTPGLNNAQLAAAEQADNGVFAPLASPALTGAPTAPTQAAGNSSTRIATTAYADAAVSVQHTADNGTYLPVAVDAGDTAAALTRRVQITDVAASKGSALQVQHHADGTGNTGSPGQAYGVEVHNFPGAASPLVVHQYSGLADMPALWIDNCDSQPIVYLHNTQNLSIAPGVHGSGAFFSLRPYGESDSLFLTDGLALYNRTTKTLSIDARNPTGAMLAIASGSNADINGVTITKAGTGAGVGLTVTQAGTGDAVSIANSSTGNALTIASSTTGKAVSVANTGNSIAVAITQANGTKHALQITQAATGTYVARLTGKDYGPIITTDSDGGYSLDVYYNGTGTGNAVQITHKGSGRALTITNGTAEVFGVTNKGVVYAAKQASQPSSSSAAGCTYVASDGSLHYRGTAGTDTQLAAA